MRGTARLTVVWILLLVAASALGASPRLPRTTRDGAIWVWVESESVGSSMGGWFERSSIFVGPPGALRPRPRARFIPHSSPDGRWIAFCFGGRPWVMRVGSGHRVRLRDAPGCSGLSWSPTGEALVFDDDDGGIYRVARNGGGLRRLAGGREPSWSARGLIAFTAYEPSTDSGTARTKIGVMRADGSGLRALTRGPDDFAPAWSPDGRRLIFVRRLQRGSWRPAIYQVNADGRALQRLAAGNQPAWSPTGTRIVFTKFAFGSGGGFGPDFYDLFVMNADGSGVRLIGRATSHAADVRARRNGPDKSFATPSWEPGSP